MSKSQSRHPKQRVEVTAWSALARCDCGWRQTYTSDLDAGLGARQHDQEMHPRLDELDTRFRLASFMRRHREARQE